MQRTPARAFSMRETESNEPEVSDLSKATKARVTYTSRVTYTMEFNRNSCDAGVTSTNIEL